MKKVIIIGDDDVNALGLIQSLGKEGLYVIAILKYEKERLICHSRYANEIVYVKDFNDVIEILFEKYIEKTPLSIFAAGDGVAFLLDKNYELLKDYFLFEHAYGDYSIEQLMNKELQIELAIKHNFNVPYSSHVSKPFCVPDDMVYPCIVKPLVSCMGDKRDIFVAQNADELKDILDNRVSFSDSVIIQQFIDKDYEYDMMGCAYKDGEVYIPLSDRMVKFNRMLQDTSTVSYIEPLDTEIAVEVERIKTLMNEIGYVGLFSVEFMHNKKDDRIYFTEVNFRNDGENAFIVHEGVNLPYLHFQDLNDIPKKEYFPIQVSKKYIWEGIHFNALLYRQISFVEWIRDLIGIDGFLYYFKEDKKPFFYQFINRIYRLLHIT